VITTIVLINNHCTLPDSFVTGFAKRGLPHTSSLSTLTILNFRLKQTLPRNLDSSEYQHSLRKFQLCSLKHKLQSSKFIELDVCGRPLFANAVTFNDLNYCHYSLQCTTLCIVDDYHCDILPLWHSRWLLLWHSWWLLLWHSGYDIVDVI